MDSVYLRIGLNGTLRLVMIVRTTMKTNSAKTLNMKLIIAIAGVNEKKIMRHTSVLSQRQSYQKANIATE